MRWFAIMATGQWPITNRGRHGATNEHSPMINLLKRSRSLPYPLARFGACLRWVVTSSETHSVSYVAEPSASWAVAGVLQTLLDIPLSEALHHVSAIDHDQILGDGMRQAKKLHGARLPHDLPQGWGKHVFYYAMIRAACIRRVLELGTYHGFGTACLIAAMRNVSDEKGGEIVTVDHRECVPNFIPEDRAVNLRRISGDVSELARMDIGNPELCVWDVVNDPSLERNAYDDVVRRTPGLRFLCSNWHGSGVLFNLSVERGWRYLAVSVPSQGHWYPGALLGVAAITQ